MRLGGLGSGENLGRVGGSERIWSKYCMNFLKNKNEKSGPTIMD